jgi:tRNA (Thr-GGU) A37 N-methylase
MPANMPLDGVAFEPIGFVSNDFNEPGDVKAPRNSESLLILDEKYIGAMDGLERYRYLLVIFQFHRSAGYRERVHPMGDRSIPERGVLATDFDGDHRDEIAIKIGQFGSGGNDFWVMKYNDNEGWL